MRKPLLAIATLVISTAAQAAPSLRVAQNDQPTAPPPAVIMTEPTEQPQPVQPKPVEAPKSAEAPKPVEPTKSAAEPAKPAASAAVAETKPQPKKAKSHPARHETAEQKARRIAAKFGVYW